MLPARLPAKSDKAERGRRCPAHRKWARGFSCCACGSQTAIECAHVRTGTDGGTGIKPSDRWCISLCADCHRQQHAMGEASFEQAYGINMKALAVEFVRRSPHRSKLEARNG